MKKKLIISNLIILFITLISVILTSSLVIYNREYKDSEVRVKDFLSLSSSYFTGYNFTETKAAILDMNSDVRLTIISKEGEIVLDTKDELTSNNELERPCLQSENLGDVFVRYSESDKKTMMFVAGLDDNYYLVISIPFTVMTTKISSLIFWGFVSFILVGGISTLLITLFIRKNLIPINSSIHSLGDLLETEIKEVTDPEDIPYSVGSLSDKISRRITEIEAKNEEITTVLDTLKQGVALISSNGRLILVNKQLKTIFEIESNVINRHYVNFIRSIELQNLIEEGLKERKASNYLYFEDGKTIKCIVTPIEMTWLTGGLVVTFEDITIEHNVNKTKKDFFQNASHELKSPLTSIIGYQQMITEGIANDLSSVRDYSHKTLGEAMRMKNILLDMLDLAMLEQDYVRVEEKVALDQVVRDIVESMEDRMKAKGISLRLNVEPTEIISEYKLIDELIRNLIDNAIKYNKDKGSIKVSLKNKELTISDTGIGIAESDKHRVFERFYRVDKGRSKDSGGTGLGLAIVKHICELYGYNITLISHIGKGTNITIDFNLKK